MLEIVAIEFIKKAGDGFVVRWASHPMNAHYQRVFFIVWLDIGG
ncbi:MAG: hypothetical protein ABR497_12505 [Kiritimatiellia bacterium]